MILNSPYISGSLIVTNNGTVSGSLTVLGGITGAITGSATSASYAISASEASTLQGLGSASFAPASTFNTVSQSYAASSASLSTRVTNEEATSSVLTSASASFAVVSSSYAAASGSLSTRVTNLEVTSSTVSQSFASTSGSISGRVTLIEGQYATTGSNTFTGPQYVSQASNAISFTSTASLYTDGGLRVSKDSFVSGTAYFNNVVVYGTSSIQYITSSQVNFGTNIITVNTDTPAVRFGGLAVFDSGSTQLTGSMLWDSEKNHWIYSNPSGSTYNSGMIISGPRNSGSLGSEEGTTGCALMMGQGGDHITSSAIFSYGNATCFYEASAITSTGVGCFSGAVCASNIISTGTICSTGNTCFGGTVILAGNVGIGTASPTVKLHVSGSGTTYGKIEGVGNNTAGLLTQNSNKQYFAGTYYNVADAWEVADITANGCTRLTITSTGIATFACQVCAPNASVVNCLGVGTAAGTGYLLDIYQPAGSTTAYARIRNNRTRNAALQFETYCANYLVGVGIGTDTNRFMIYDNNAGATRLTLDQCGNIGLGTTPAPWVSTAKAFQISSYNSIASQHNGSFNIMSEAYENTANAFAYGTTGGYPTRINMNPNDGVISIFNAPTGTAGGTVTWCERLRITSEGYLGTTVTGTTVSDGDLLGVLAFVSRDSSTYSSGGITNIRSYATQTYNTGNVAGDLRFYVTNGAQNTTGTYLFGTEAMRITCNGNVVIGNTTAYGGLTVSDFTANDGNDAISLFYRGTSGAHESLIKFYDFRGQVNASIGNNLEDDGSGTQKARLVFKTACNGSPVERMRIAPNGVVRIGTCAISLNTNANVALQVAGAIRFGNPDGEYVQSYGGGISARSLINMTPGSATIIIKGLGGSGFLYQVFGFTGTGKRFTDLLLGVNNILSVVSSVVEAGPATRCYTITSENLNLCLSGVENYNIVSHGFGAVER